MLLGNFDHDIRRWGWTAGAVVAAIDCVRRLVKARRGPAVNPVAGDVPPKETEPAPPLDDPERKSNRFVGSLAALLAGLILGTFFATFLVFGWASLALSPFSPAAWHGQIKTNFLSLGFPFEKTQLIVYGVTMAFFGLLGLLAGMMGGVRVSQGGAGESGRGLPP